MISKHVAFVLSLMTPILLTGCMSHSHPPLTQINGDSRIAYMDSKYRVCRGNCPQRTKKYLDDSEYIAMANQMSAQTQAATNQSELQKIASPDAQNVPPESAAMTINAGNTGNAERSFEIHFEFGKSNPTKDGLKTLKLLPADAKEATSIELLGETDSIGTQYFNNKLAFARAHFVARWLKDHGVSTRISVESKGECCLASPYDKAEKTLKNMRRVKVNLFIQSNKEDRK